MLVHSHYKMEQNKMIVYGLNALANVPVCRGLPTLVHDAMLGA